MKTMKFMMSVLSVAILLTGCNMSNTGKGPLIGTTAGAAAGTGLGALSGKLTGNTKMGAGIGAAACGDAAADGLQRTCSPGRYHPAVHGYLSDPVRHGDHHPGSCRIRRGLYGDCPADPGWGP